MRYLLLDFIVVFLFTSCDTVNQIDYNIVNNSDQIIKIIYNHWDYDTSMYITSDTIARIAPNNKQLLVRREIIGSGIWNPEINNEEISMLNKFELYLDDSIHIERNFKEIENWAYKRTGRFNAELNLIINKDNLKGTNR